MRNNESDMFVGGCCLVVWDAQPMRQPIYPSRGVTLLFAISVFVLIADLVIIFVLGGHPGVGKLLGFVGSIGVLGSVWINHEQVAR